MTHACTSSVCLSVFAPSCPLFSSLGSSSIPLCQPCCFSNRPIHPLKVHPGCGQGGREGGLQWMSIPVVSEVTAGQRRHWQQHWTPQFAHAGMCDIVTVQSHRNRPCRIPFVHRTLSGFQLLGWLAFTNDLKWWSSVAFCLKRQEKGSCIRHIIKPVDYQTIFYVVLPTASRQQELKRLRFWEWWRQKVPRNI